MGCWRIRQGLLHLLAIALCLSIAGCGDDKKLASTPLVRAPFPVFPLLTQRAAADKSAVPVAAGATRRARVQWHTEHLGDEALKVRHAMEPLPGLKFEVIFDGELFTYAAARSWHGHLADDLAGQVTLSTYRDHIWLTIDSAKYGVIVVRDEADNTATGVGAFSSERDLARIPFARDDPGSFAEMLRLTEKKNLIASALHEDLTQQVTNLVATKGDVTRAVVRDDSLVRQAEQTLARIDAEIKRAEIAVPAIRSPETRALIGQQTALTTQLAVLQKEVALAKTDIASCATQADTLPGQIAALTNNISVLQATLATATAAAGAATAQLTNAEAAAAASDGAYGAAAATFNVAQQSCNALFANLSKRTATPQASASVGTPAVAPIRPTEPRVQNCSAALAPLQVDIKTLAAALKAARAREQAARNDLALSETKPADPVPPDDKAKALAAAEAQLAAFLLREQQLAANVATTQKQCDALAAAKPAAAPTPTPTPQPRPQNATGRVEPMGTPATAGTQGAPPSPAAPSAAGKPLAAVEQCRQKLAILRAQAARLQETIRVSRGRVASAKAELVSSSGVGRPSGGARPSAGGGVTPKQTALTLASNEVIRINGLYQQAVAALAAAQNGCKVSDASGAGSTAPRPSAPGGTVSAGGSVNPHAVPIEVTQCRERLRALQLIITQRNAEVNAARGRVNTARENVARVNARLLEATNARSAAEQQRGRLVAAQNSLGQCQQKAITRGERADAGIRALQSQLAGLAASINAAMQKDDASAFSARQNRIGALQANREQALVSRNQALTQLQLQQKRALEITDKVAATELAKRAALSEMEAERNAVAQLQSIEKSARQRQVDVLKSWRGVTASEVPAMPARSRVPAPKSAKRTAAFDEDQRQSPVRVASRHGSIQRVNFVASAEMSHVPRQAQSQLAQQKSTPATNAANTMSAPGTTSPPPVIRGKDWPIDPACADAPGRIDVNVLVSKKVWTARRKAEPTLGETAARALLEGEMVHALDSTNTSLKRSNASHPVLDVGFRMIGINVNADIADNTAHDEPFAAWQRYQDNPTSVDNEVKKIAGVGSADLVLAVIAGDGRIDTMRGTATIGDAGISFGRPYAVVKYIALDYKEVHTVPHELGHILGAGHDSADQKANGMQSSTGGDPDMASYARGLNQLNGGAETLMALSACNQAVAGSAASFSCRRVPYYSNQEVRYPDFDGQALGTTETDNVGAMRLTRDRVARNGCERAVSASGVWMKSLPPPSSTVATQQSLTPVPATTPSPMPWESLALWRRDASDSSEWRSVYQHKNVEPGGATQFVSAILHNNSVSEKVGTLALWRIPAPLGGGRLLSPQWRDLQRLNGADNATGVGSPCTTAIRPGNASPNGALKLAAGRTTIVEMPCQAGTFAVGDEPLLARWIGEGAVLSNAIANDTPLLNLVSGDSLALWRSTTVIPLTTNSEKTERVVLRNVSQSARALQLRIVLEPGQGNFRALDSGVSSLRFATPKAYCVASPENKKLACGGSGYGVADDESFIVDANGAAFDLSLPPGAVLPVDITFKRTRATPQTDVMVRVFEVDPTQNRALGGASFVVQAKRQ